MLGIAKQKEGEWFAVRRKDGRLSRFVFRSPLRAADHAMRAAKCDSWPVLADNGVRIVAVVPSVK